MAADFLKYSVAFIFKKFIRIVRSERVALMSDEVSLKNPAECSLFLQSMFDHLSEDLSDNVSRAQEEVHYRVRLAREAGITPKLKSTTSKSKTPSLVEKKKDVSTRPCAGHLWKQLKAVYADGRGYQCTYGKKCIFQHVGKKGKTEKELSDLIASIPELARGDLRKAAKLQV